MVDFPKVDLYRREVGTCYRRLAWVLAIEPGLARRDVDRALGFAQKACDLEPGDPANHTSLGMAYYRAGNWKAAVAALRKGAELRKLHTTDGALFLAMALWRLGEKEAARTAYESAVRWMEDNEDHPDFGPDLVRCRVEAETVLGLTVNANEQACEPVRPGQVVKGTLGRDDPTDSFPLTGKSHRKVHVADLEAGKSYVIDLKGAFDTFLRVEDSKRKPLLFNNDICPREKDGLDSRVVFTPPEKGAYRIIATSAGAGATGAYTLRIREAAPVGEPVVRKGQLAKTDRSAQGRFFVVHNVKLVGGCPYTLELNSSNQQGKCRRGCPL
jgi:hypothetical protein